MRIAEFVKEVKLGASKVSWPTLKESAITCGVVLLVVAIASAFFLAVDSVIYRLVRFILGI